MRRRSTRKLSSEPKIEDVRKLNLRSKNENVEKVSLVYGDTWACVGTRCQAPKQKSEMRPFQNGAGRSHYLSKVVSPAICTISFNTSVDQRCFGHPRRRQPLGCNSSQVSSRKTHVLMMSPGGRSAIRLNNIICINCNILGNALFCTQLSTSSLETRLMKECGMKRLRTSNLRMLYVGTQSNVHM